MGPRLRCTRTVGGSDGRAIPQPNGYTSEGKTMEVFTGSLLMVVALFGGCSFIHADPPPVNTSQPSPAPVPVKPPAVATGVLTNRTVRTVMVGGIEAEGHLVFRDEHAWDRFCQKNDLRERPKLVNWDKDIVIVAFMGKIFAKD